jgi:dCMP deaminase
MNKSKIKDKWIEAHLQVSQVYAANSYCERQKVGCIIVKNDSVISIGINGTPPGDENVCEFQGKTKPTVMHAEANAIAKLAKSTQSSEGAIAFIIISPCIECAKLLFAAGISAVYYKDNYRDNTGLKFLEDRGIYTKQVLLST